MTIEVNIISPVAGDNFSYKGGDIADLPDDQAAGWIEQGLAISAPTDEVAGAAIADLREENQRLHDQAQGLIADKAELEDRLAQALAANASLKATFKAKG